jgi:cytochrome c556
VTIPDRGLSHPRRRAALAIAGVAACFLSVGFAAIAQDQSAAIAKDVIFARKTLMNSIMGKMDQIADMISQGKIDLAAAHEHADQISVMFMAFPHLFPPSSNQWKEDADLDPVTDTIASPDIWPDYADFYRRAAAAAKTAYEMSRADNEDEIKRLNRALGNACDTCHAMYLKEQ